MTMARYLTSTAFLLVAGACFSPHPNAWAQSDATEAPAFTPVTAERLVNAEAEPHNWLTYSGNYKAQRYSGLDQIDRRNVAGLEIAWVYQLQALDRAETTPLVVDGVMYITESPSTVIAVDAGTGRPYWRYEHALPDEVIICCGRNNRGVAVQGDRVLMSTLDAHLVALDARTGNVLWDVEVQDSAAGYSKTAAPLVVGDKVFTGVAGGEYGIRGLVDAYDIESGERAWRFYTTPSPDHPDSRTWSGDSWRTGGSATWMTGSYDPELNLVYWGTGNPGPRLRRDGARGRQPLLRLRRGARRPTRASSARYFQFTPHDIHDWDSTQIPDAGRHGVRGRAAQADALPRTATRSSTCSTRETGEFLLGKPYARQTWAEGLDETGRPILLPGKEPTPEGTVVSPAITGGSNWWSPTYSPRTGLIYVMAYDAETRYFIPPDRVSGRPELPRRRRRVAAASRQLRPRRAGALAPDRRPALGVPGRPAHHVRI